MKKLCHLLRKDHARFWPWLLIWLGVIGLDGLNRYSEIGYVGSSSVQGAMRFLENAFPWVEMLMAGILTGLVVTEDPPGRRVHFGQGLPISRRCLFLTKCLLGWLLVLPFLIECVVLAHASFEDALFRRAAVQWWMDRCPYYMLMFLVAAMAGTFAGYCSGLLIAALFIFATYPVFTWLNGMFDPEAKLYWGRVPSRNFMRRRVAAGDRDPLLASSKAADFGGRHRCP